jgi:hypothetical protein
MQFKTTLYHQSIPAGQVVNNPLGLEDASLVLQRNKYNGIVEQFDAELIFYGDAHSLINSIVETYGIHREVRIVIEAAFNLNEWFVLYTGNLDLYAREVFYENDVGFKSKIHIIQDNNWTRFINKTSQKYEFIFNSKINFPSNTLVQRYVRSTTHDLTSIAPGIGRGNYLMINTIEAESTIADRFEYGNQLSDELPTSVKKYFIKCKYSGTYVFTYNIGIRFRTVPSGRTLEYVIVRRSGSSVTTESLGTGVTGSGPIYFSGTKTFSCQRGDELYLYATLSGSFTSDVIFDADFFTGTDVFYSKLEVKATTTYVATNVYGIDVDGAATAIIDGLDSEADVDTGVNASLVHAQNVVNKNVVQVSYGPVNTTYDVIVNVIEGLYLGIPWSMSFDEWYNGIFPIFPIGVDYNNNKVRVRQLDFFYTDGIAPLYLNTYDATASVDNSLIKSSIKVGFEKVETKYRGDEHPTEFGNAQYVSGLNVGDNELNLTSKFIADVNVIEELRRKEKELDGIIILETITENFTDPISGLPLTYTTVQMPVNENLKLINNTRYDRLVSISLALKGTDLFFKKTEAYGNHRPFVIQFDNPYHTPVVIRFKSAMSYDDYLTIKDYRYGIFSCEIGDFRLKGIKYYLSGGYAEIEGYVMQKTGFLLLEDGGYLLFEDGEKIKLK